MDQPSAPAGRLWRIFPWDPLASDGDPYSARFIPPVGSQTGGRFDLGNVPVLYLAESAEHALAEVLQRFRSGPLRPSHLWRRDSRQPNRVLPLALVETRLPSEVEAGLPDLGDPVILQRFGIRPDHLASSDRRTTQAISRALHDRGLQGLRWWSALSGDWHATVLYLDRVDVREIVYGEPDALSVDHPTVRETARLLGMPIREA